MQKTTIYSILLLALCFSAVHSIRVHNRVSAAVSVLHHNTEYYIRNVETGNYLIVSGAGLDMAPGGSANTPWKYKVKDDSDYNRQIASLKLANLNCYASNNLACDAGNDNNDKAKWTFYNYGAIQKLKGLNPPTEDFLKYTLRNNKEDMYL
mmetsp:Transcript_4419/g.3659  ORF Transcript_4419/g.3659 Transcript_4419/m.3659 type:complete len:151 (+) Transcript_4419:218-670(+)